MEKKKTIFDYLMQIMIIFGFSMLILNIFCIVFGESARNYSAIFELGSQGIPVSIVFQFMGTSILITGMQFLFFTDIFIKKMSLQKRTICMCISVIIIMAVFIAAFHWFPVNEWLPWLMFLICFGVSFLGSYIIITIKEKIENKQLEEALRRLKEN